MAIVKAATDAYCTDDDLGISAMSEQFVRELRWSNRLYQANAPKYFPLDGPFGTGAWAWARYSSEYGRQRLDAAVGATYCFGVWFKHAGSSANCIAIRLGNDSNAHSRIYFGTTGEISYQRNTTTLGTGSSTFTFGRWHYLSFKVLIDNATGTVDVELDGNNILSLTTQDTYEGTAGAEVKWFELYGDDDHDLRFCQPVLWTTTGDAPTGLLGGMMKGWSLRPTADTAQADWTAQGAGDNYEEIDHAEADDATYVSADTSADEDQYAVEDLPETPTTIYAVQSRVLAAQTDAGTLGLKSGVKSGTTEDYSTERKCALDPEYHTHLLTENPDDSAPWAAADVNACLLGIEVG